MNLENAPILKPLRECSDEEVLQRFSEMYSRKTAPRWVVIVMNEELRKRRLVESAYSIADKLDTKGE